MPNPTYIDDLAAADLALAIESGEFFLAYQPKIAIASGDFVGVEALARWKHPQLGFVPPARFIPLAKLTGLIEQLTRLVILVACDQWQAWTAVGLQTKVAINLSAKDVDRSELADELHTARMERAMPDTSLTIEVSERTALTARRLFELLSDLHMKGTRIALDDFATGYSLLSDLPQLPLSEIKISPSFVTDVDRSRERRTIVQSIIAFAHRRALRVVAVGVENNAVLDLLAEWDCDEAQGYHIGRPMTGNGIAEWVAARPKASQ
ncbi:MAG: EAL domain-containing protein [Rhodospirillales bacterium]|nr:EAL domain-containing protein [Rhodospirillales bacterium]